VRATRGGGLKKIKKIVFKLKKRVVLLLLLLLLLFVVVVGEINVDENILAASKLGDLSQLLRLPEHLCVHFL
jgi:hypothetical protein